MKFKRKKNTRLRGSHTHGGGSKKKRRGAGNRGGRGKAGSGKRGDAKKPLYWKNKRENYGKLGFKNGSPSKIKTININVLNDKIDSLVNQKKAELKNNTYVIDLTKLKIGKLLGAGTTTKKFEIIVDSASQKAIEKITKAGGSVKTKNNSKDSD